MNETFEISDTRTTIVTENGKKCYQINIPHSNSWISSDSQCSKLAPFSQDSQDPTEEAKWKENIAIPQLEQTGPLHYYGENMVMKSAREMFKNVDILADGRYFCCICNRPYKTHATLTAHLRGSHLRQESHCVEPGCNHVSYTENERRKHQKIHDRKKYSKISRDSFRAQQKFEESISEISQPNEKTLREQTIRSSRVAGTITTMDKRGKIRYTCTECHSAFRNAYHATRHVETHNEAFKHCFYCGEVRNGTMDLHVHYMRFHKNEGVRTITCMACQRGFTTTTLFRNHASQKECELACRELSIRQDIYYGELPDGTITDYLTLNRLKYFRKKQEQQAAGEPADRHMELETCSEMGGATCETVSVTDETCGLSPATKKRSMSDDIFDGTNSLILTEFGLKNLAEFKTSRADKRGIPSESNDQYTVKRDRVLMRQNNVYYHDNHDEPLDEGPVTTTQQQNDGYQMDYVYQPPAYGYDPLIGRYPDFQPMQQLQDPFPYGEYFYDQPDQENLMREEQIVEETVQPEPQESLEMAPGSLVSDEQDDVFGGLDDLDFGIPSNNQQLVDGIDLDEFFNF